MPWLHRLACFRDDLIFVVYLYQRWVYPEDKRRRNEFGQVGDTEGRDDDEFNDSDDEVERDEKVAVIENDDTGSDGVKQKEGDEVKKGNKSEDAVKADGGLRKRAARK